MIADILDGYGKGIKLLLSSNNIKEALNVLEQRYGLDAFIINFKARLSDTVKGELKDIRGHEDIGREYNRLRDDILHYYEQKEKE